VLVAQVAIVGLSLAICAWVIRERRSVRDEPPAASESVGPQGSHQERLPKPEIESTTEFTPAA
jgi:hypothetical protein